MSEAGQTTNPHSSSVPKTTVRGPPASAAQQDHAKNVSANAISDQRLDELLRKLEPDRLVHHAKSAIDRLQERWQDEIDAQKTIKDKNAQLHYRNVYLQVQIDRWSQRMQSAPSPDTIAEQTQRINALEATLQEKDKTNQALQEDLKKWRDVYTQLQPIVISLQMKNAEHEKEIVNMQNHASQESQRLASERQVSGRLRQDLEQGGITLSRTLRQLQSLQQDQAKLRGLLQERDQTIASLYEAADMRRQSTAAKTSAQRINITQPPANQGPQNSINAAITPHTDDLPDDEDDEDDPIFQEAMSADLDQASASTQSTIEARKEARNVKDLMEKPPDNPATAAQIVQGNLNASNTKSLQDESTGKSAPSNTAANESETVKSTDTAALVHAVPEASVAPTSVQPVSTLTNDIERTESSFRIQPSAVNKEHVTPVVSTESATNEIAHGNGSEDPLMEDVVASEEKTNDESVNVPDDKDYLLPALAKPKAASPLRSEQISANTSHEPNGNVVPTASTADAALPPGAIRLDKSKVKQSNRCTRCIEHKKYCDGEPLCEECKMYYIVHEMPEQFCNYPFVRKGLAMGKITPADYITNIVNEETDAELAALQVKRGARFWRASTEADFAQIKPTIIDDEVRPLASPAALDAQQRLTRQKRISLVESTSRESTPMRKRQRMTRSPSTVSSKPASHQSECAAPDGRAIKSAKTSTSFDIKQESNDP